MGRRPKCRFVGCEPSITALKPAGVPARQLESVELGLDELEALRLGDLEGLYFDAAGEQMGLSRATFGRLIERARHKVADAIVNGKMLVFKGGNVAMNRIRVFHCDDCDSDFAVEPGTGRPNACPGCGSEVIQRVIESSEPSAGGDPQPAGDEVMRGGRQGRDAAQGGGRGRRRARCGRGGRGGR